MFSWGQIQSASTLELCDRAAGFPEQSGIGVVVTSDGNKCNKMQINCVVIFFYANDVWIKKQLYLVSISMVERLKTT